MEEVSISELTEFTTLQGSDLFVAVDNTVTKKITYSSMTGSFFTDLGMDAITGYTGLNAFATGQLVAATGAFEVATGLLSTATGSVDSDINKISGSLVRQSVGTALFHNPFTGTPNFCITLASTGNVGNNAYTFNLGNEGAIPSAQGVVLPFDCRLVAVSMNVDCTATTHYTGNVLRNNSAVFDVIKTWTTSDENYSKGLGGVPSTVTFSAGDRLNFRTEAAKNTSFGNSFTTLKSTRVGLWFSIY